MFNKIIILSFLLPAIAVPQLKSLQSMTSQYFRIQYEKTVTNDDVREIVLLPRKRMNDTELNSVLVSMGRKIFLFYQLRHDFGMSRVLKYSMMAITKTIICILLPALIEIKRN